MVWKERMSEYWMIGLLLFLIAVFSYISPVFATRGNLSNFLRSIPVLGIATLGVAMLMISGGIDLSLSLIHILQRSGSPYRTDQQLCCQLQIRAA